jgi:hypothetical protein
LALRLALAALAFAVRTFLSLSAFSFKLRARLFFLRRAYISKMKRALDEGALPEDLREELLKLYCERLDGLLSSLRSTFRATNLVRSLFPRGALKEC